MDDHRIPKDVFVLLIQDIYEIAKKEDIVLWNVDEDGNRKLKSSSFWNNKHKRTLTRLIREDEAVNSYIKEQGENPSSYDFGHWLYRKINLLDKTYSEQTQNLVYGVGIFRFVGATDVSDYVQRNKDRLANTASLRDQPIYSGGKKTKNYYIGTYFSVKNYQCKLFTLEIDFSRPKDKKYPCRQWGFHVYNDDNLHEDNYQVPDQIQSIEFTGWAYTSGSCLFCDLAAKNDGIDFRMNIMGIRKIEQSIDTQRIIPCSLQTNTLGNYITTVEIVLVKSDRQSVENIVRNPEVFLLKKPLPKDSIHRDEQPHLFLYLMLQRRNFWITHKNIVDRLTELEVKAMRVEQFTERLPSYWRIWNMGIGEKGRIIQSYLSIKGSPSFKSFLHPYIHPDILTKEPRLEKQAAVMTLSDEKICFSSYIIGKASHLRLVNFAIFDLSKVSTKLGDGYAEGIYISAGKSGERGLIGGYCVMAKIDKFDKKRDGPRVLSKSEAEKMAAELNLQRMYEGLYLLWKTKHERQQNRIDVYGICFDNEKRYLLVKKQQGYSKGKWEFPGGPIDFDKDPQHAVRTHFHQQTGLEATFSELKKVISSISFDRDLSNKKVHYHTVGVLYDVGVDSSTGLDPLKTTWKTKEEIDSGVIELTEVAKQIFKDIKNLPEYAKSLVPDKDAKPEESNIGEL